MGEVRYMISEAAKRVAVETHVLRYWEEELLLPIGRTEMGHRYYTPEDVQLFCCIKELKEQGVLLKELKNLVPEMKKTRAKLHSVKEDGAKIGANARLELQSKQKKEVASAATAEDSKDKLEQVRSLIGDVLKEIITENNKCLSQEVSLTVSRDVKKEMDYLLQSKDRLEDERFKKLDRLIRQQQVMRKEGAHLSPARKLKQLLGVGES